MSVSLKRKLELQQGNGIPVEWVDEEEWSAIERAFNALQKARVEEPLGQEEGPSRVISSRSASTVPSMVPSVLPSPAAASGHQFYQHRAFPGHRQRGSEGLRQRECCCPAVICPNSNGDGGASLWKKGAGIPSQFATGNGFLGGGGSIRTHCAKGDLESPSNDRISEQERAGSDFLPGSLNPELLVAPDAVDPFSELSEVPNAEDGSRESARKQLIRRLPAWMESARQFLLPMGRSPSSEQARDVSRLDGGGTNLETSVERVKEEVEKTRKENAERLGAVASAQQESENGRPFWFPLEQPQWGLQPSSFVEEMKPKFPSMQFRGQIVYSKTNSEVSAATDELWRRVRELQATAQGAVPIGFDLEWKPVFDKGEEQRKVAVMQLCLDGRRCDVMHIIYSGIPMSLRDLLETPSTVKVGVGIWGDVSRLSQDYQITTRKIVDLRVVANQKMKNVKQWSLSSLAVELTGKQVEKIRSIRCGDWEALPLSEPQLQYAATDAFASLHLYQVLASFPTPVEESNQNVCADSRTDQQPPIT